MTTPDKTTEATGQVMSVNLMANSALGGCNACTRYLNRDHVVFLVTLRNCLFALCPNCARDLVALLQKHDPGRKARK
jgi:hypothetical protein